MVFKKGKRGSGIPMSRPVFRSLRMSDDEVLARSTSQLLLKRTLIPSTPRTGRGHGVHRDEERVQRIAPGRARGPRNVDIPRKKQAKRTFTVFMKRLWSLQSSCFWDSLNNSGSLNHRELNSFVLFVRLLLFFAFLLVFLYGRSADSEKKGRSSSVYSPSFEFNQYNVTTGGEE